MQRSSFTFALGAACCLAATPAVLSAQEGHGSPLVGVWEPQRYLLKDGTQHDVAGLIFFTEHHWTVLFFVLGEDEAPKRGSSEGGTYDLTGDQLVFTHLYHLSSGEAMESLPASALRMEINEISNAPREPARVEIRGDDLMIHFPSGNSMSFARR